MSRLPIDAVVATLPKQPSPPALQAARSADQRASWAESEAKQARAAGRAAVADRFEERAHGMRAEALRALRLEP